MAAIPLNSAQEKDARLYLNGKGRQYKKKGRGFARFDISRREDSGSSDRGEKMLKKRVPNGQPSVFQGRGDGGKKCKLKSRRGEGGEGT